MTEKSILVFLEYQSHSVSHPSSKFLCGLVELAAPVYTWFMPRGIHLHIHCIHFIVIIYLDDLIVITAHPGGFRLIVIPLGPRVA